MSAGRLTGRSVPPALLAGLLVVVLSGCTGAARDPEAVRSPEPVPERTTRSATPSPSLATQPPTAAETVTGPAATTAGGLGADDFPPATLFGPEWTTYADPGGSEKGFEGNGTFVRARDPHHAAFEALPLGCVGEPPAGLDPAIPTAALVGSYAAGPARAWVTVLSFGSAREAASYVRSFAAVEAACGSDPGAFTAVQVDSAPDASATSYRSTRHLDGVAWRQVMHRAGARVWLAGAPTDYDRSRFAALLP